MRRLKQRLSTNGKTMQLLLNPILDALEVARRAAGKTIGADDEISVDDRDDYWEFEFVPHKEVLGGGVQVSIAKDSFRVLRVVRGQ